MKKKHLLLTVTALYAAYFLNYVIKLCPSVVMPQLQAELGLSSSMTGLLSSLYFLPYAVMQFFVGGLCRKFSAQRVIATGLLICSLGLLCFGLGTTPLVLALGRLLLGFGSCPFFIGMVYFLQRFYSGTDYVRIYGYSIFISNVGSALATAPLKALIGRFGRGGVFMGISGVAVTLSVFLLALYLLSGDKEEKSGEESALKNALSSIRLVFSSRVLVSGLILWLIQGAHTMSYQGLWCVKWTDVAFPGFESWTALSGMFIAFGVMLSSLICEKVRFYGPFVNRESSRKRTFYLGGWLAVFSVVASTFVKFLPSSSPSLVLSLLLDVLYGYAGANIVVQGGAYVRENSDAKRNADIMGVYNGLGCFSQQLSQWLTGLGVDAFLLKFSLNTSFSLTFLLMDAVFALMLLGVAKEFRD
ncbi:MAG: MFS transporter [Spirochaetales bacterium]|nr:MFS transporter [Candidatus Physcosoma equi]